MKTFLQIAMAGALVLAHVFAQAQEAPATPGPEHEHLKKMEGEWNVKMQFGEAAEATAEGTSTQKMEMGGLWLTSHFKSEMFGMPFEGRGFDSYDAKKGKYVSVWVDSMSTRPFTLEGTFDKEKKTLTMKGEAPDGRPMKSVTQVKDADTIIFTMYVIADGKEEKMMTSVYTRKK